MPKSDALQLIIPRRLKYVLLCFLLVLTGGCASGRSSSSNNYADMMKLPAPLRTEGSYQAGQGQVLLQGKEQIPWKKDSTTVFSETPHLVGRENMRAKEDSIPKEVVQIEGKPVSINFKDMPLPAFINHVYGDILNKSFTLPPQLNEKKDLVTLRSKADMTPTELYTLATEIIAQYGVKVSFQDELLTFSIIDQRPGEIPLLISGRTLPEVPISHRPIFQLVELAVVRNTMVASWLRAAFKDQSAIEIFEDPMRNAILLKGSYSLVQLAIDMIQVLDQPHMRSRHSLRVDPVYMDAKSLSTQLINILSAEGINVGEKDTSVILLPVTEINALLVFAPDQGVLDHIRQWIQSIDRPGQLPQTGNDTSGVFAYQVRNTTAKSIAEVLNTLVKNLPAETEGQAKPVQAADADAKTPERQKEKKDKTKSTGEVIVDEVRNSLIFQGSGDRWNKLLPMIHSMDQTDRMVLLEVIIAEITLDENETLGINWSHTKGDARFGTAALDGGDAGLTVGGSGFSFVLDTAGSVYARLSAFAEKKKLAILSTPRLMVKNGTEASIEVGKEVPFISRAVTSSTITTAGTTGIVSETQYRKTGILLQVKPTVFSGNRVELQLSQEASETTPDDTNSTSSPSIYNRKIDTSLTLKDGSSILLGGLITTNRSQSSQGVPWISDIPYLGRLFKVDGAKATRTEMVMLIVPYIVDNDGEAKSLTKAFLDRLSYKANKLEDEAGKPVPSVELPSVETSPLGKLPAVRTPDLLDQIVEEPAPVVITPR